MKTFIICILFSAILFSFTGAWKGEKDATVFNADSINTRTAVVGDTLLVGTLKVYLAGTYLQVLGNGVKAKYFTTTSGGGITTSGTAKIGILMNNNALPLDMRCGLSFNDSILNSLTGANGDTVYTVDSLNNMRVYNNLTVDDTFNLGGGADVYKIDIRNDSLFFISGTDTFVAEKK